MWQELRTELHPRGLEVVTVALDVGGADAAGTWIDLAKPEHPALIDAEHRLDELLGVVNVPTGVWIDEQGMIVRPPEPAFPGKYIPGRFTPSSIRVYKASASGDVPPIRTLQGNKTQLAWPMGITVDKPRNELLVANYASNSILFFPVTASCDVAPARYIGGPHTGIVGPVGVAVDTKNNEIWVANYGDHSAVVFDRNA